MALRSRTSPCTFWLFAESYHAPYTPLCVTITDTHLLSEARNELDSINQNAFMNVFIRTKCRRTRKQNAHTQMYTKTRKNCKTKVQGGSKKSKPSILCGYVNEHWEDSRNVNKYEQLQRKWSIVWYFHVKYFSSVLSLLNILRLKAVSAYTFVLTFPIDLPSQIFKLISNEWVIS